MEVLDQEKNELFNLIKEQEDIDKIYLYPKDLSEGKYKFLIQKRKNAGMKHLNDPYAFIECSNKMDDIYSNNDDYNPTRERKKLVAFDDMIVDIIPNKKIASCCERIVYQMQEVKHFTCIYHTIPLYFCKRSQIKFNALFCSDNLQ